MKQLFTSRLIALCLALHTHSSWAQGDVHDPMRPPANLAAASKPASVAAPENVQMLLMGGQRSFAMVDGVIVKPGESLKAWRLVSIGSHSVVMRHAAVTEEISIHPAVVKTVKQPTRSRP